MENKRKFIGFNKSQKQFFFDFFFQIMIDCISRGVFMHGSVSGVFERELPRNRRTDTDDAARAQWRNVAIVMDRCFFILYVLTIVVTSLLLFPKHA